MCDKTLKVGSFFKGKKLRQKQNFFSNKQKTIDFLIVIHGRMALTKMANSFNFC